MTTTSSGHPRPHTSIFPPPQSPFRAPSRRSSVDITPRLERRASVDLHVAVPEDYIDGRASKRRKIEDQASLTPPPQTPISRSAIRSGGDGATRLWRAGLGVPWADLNAVEGDDEPDFKPPPLPARPWKTNITPKFTFEEGKCGDRTRKNIPVSNVPDKLEAPSDAPRFRTSGLAGYFPWVGKHPEDSSRDQHIKNGYSDHPPNPQERELASAKSTLYKLFKDKGGLNTLSTAFALLLDQKSSPYGTSTSSTFRLPPRVTMTEAKRRSWLGDLANPNIPLRRLNRTIPQGIRGQGLLEQCQMHTIPLARAIWFAKCVGANEIRTLKRKGPGNTTAVGNENKWLRDWTVSVEQFVESTIREATSKVWKPTVEYALRLSTRLYLENLLEREHYLDWIVKSFNTSDVTQTPFWLMLVHVFAVDLVRFRKRGTRLAVMLAERLKDLSGANEPLLRPLMLRLKYQIKTLLRRQRLCFLVPEQWPAIESTIHECTDIHETAEIETMSYLYKSTKLCMGANSCAYGKTPSPKQQLIEFLDSLKGPYTRTNVYVECCARCPDPSTMISTTLEWATTRFRASQARVYLAAQILKQAQKQGADVEYAIFCYANPQSASSSLDHSEMSRLFAELARLQVFSVSRYLQWLSIRGGIQNQEKLSPQEGSDSEVISPTPSKSTSYNYVTDLPLQGLSEHVVNLRNTLLAKGGFDLSKENELCCEIQALLSSILPNLLFECDARIFSEADLLSKLRHLPWSIRTHISFWIRDNIVSACSKHVERVKLLGYNAPGTSLDIRTFCVVRQTLETLEDFVTLADVLDSFATIPHEAILAACVDTLDRNKEVFLVIGRFAALHSKLGQAYITFRLSKPSLPLLATSLLSLDADNKNATPSKRILRVDLVRGDRGAAINACSPFSEGIAASLQQAGDSFLEDFDAILQSENNMSEETMTQLFGVIVGRFAKAYDRTDDLHAQLIQLMARLRLHRTSAFDKLSIHWQSTMAKGDLERFALLLPHFICTGCVDFGDVMGVFADNFLSSTIPAKSAAIIASALSFEDAMEFTDSVSYRYNTVRLQHASRYPLDYLQSVQNVSGFPEVTARLGHTLRSIVCNAVVAGSKPSSLQFQSLREHLVTYVSESIDCSEPNPAQNMILLYHNLDDFNKHHIGKTVAAQCSEKSAEETFLMTEALIAVALNDSNEGIDTRLPSILSQDALPLCRQVRERALAQFFPTLPTFLQSKNSANPSGETPFDTAAQFVCIATIASQHLESAASSTLSAQLTEKFTLLARALGGASVVTTSNPLISAAPASATTATTPNISESSTSAMKYLPLLLKVLCLHRCHFTSTATSKQTQQDLFKLLVLLVSIALHPNLQSTTSSPAPVEDQSNDNEEPTHQATTEPTPDLSTQTLHVAATLVDDLSDEARSLCTRFLKDKMRDPRVQFLLGSVTTCGSAMTYFGRHEVSAGLVMQKNSAAAEAGGAPRSTAEWKPRVWEVLEGSGGAGAGTGNAANNDGTWVPLRMFGVTGRSA